MVRLSTEQQPPKLWPTTSVHSITNAAHLDRLADYELHLGHHVAAEHLARRAAELREAGQ